MPRPLKWPPIFPIQKGLVAWYTFNDRSGTVLKDRSGKKNHGTLVGPTWVAGRRGSALSFNGIDDFLIVSDNASIRFTIQDFTVLFWVNLRVLNTTQVIAMKGVWETEGWKLWFNSDNKFYLGTFQSGAGQLSYSIAITTLNVWVHIAIVRDGSVVTIYKDGADITEGHVTHIDPVAETNDLIIGKDITDVQFFNGTIDEFYIYNRALTAAEVKRRCESEVMLVRH